MPLRFASVRFAVVPLLAAVAAAVAAAAACGGAYAVRGADVPPPTPEAVRAAHPAVAGRAAREQAADAALALREGKVTAVDAAAGRVDIDGAAFRLVDGRSRIYRRGASVAATALRSGQPVAYAVAASPAAPGDATAATTTVADRDNAIAVIHVR